MEKSQLERSYVGVWPELLWSQSGVQVSALVLYNQEIPGRYLTCSSLGVAHLENETKNNVNHKELL